MTAHLYLFRWAEAIAKNSKENAQMACLASAKLSFLTFSCLPNALRAEDHSFVLSHILETNEFLSCETITNGFEIPSANNCGKFLAL